MGRVLTNGDAHNEEETLTREQAMGEFMFLNLRQLEGFLPSYFAERFGDDLRETFSHIDTLIADGLLTQEEGKVKLSERGLFLADSVFASFF
jgi:oxygen-independent coproporphyrinogen-3 oxidase